MAEWVEWIEEGARFEAIAPAWEDLARHDPSPFAGPRWYGPWWRAFGGRRRLALCVLWRDDRLAGVLPLLAGRGRLEAMANEHTPRLRPAARDPEALATLIRAAVDTGAGLLELHPVSEEDAALTRREAEAGRRFVLAEHAHTSPIVEATGDFADYRKARKSAWSDIERRRRKLQRECDVRLDVVASPHDVDRDMDAALVVEASGWKGRQGTAIASSPLTNRFYREMARAFHGSGELRLSRLHVDGRLAAVDLALVRGDRYFLLKTGYDESFRRAGPGLVLRLAVVERCFEMGLDHEFLGDEANYKQLFATGARDHLHLRLYRRRPLAATTWAYRRAARPALKRAYRTLRRPGEDASA